MINLAFEGRDGETVLPVAAAILPTREAASKTTLWSPEQGYVSLPPSRRRRSHLSASGAFLSQILKVGFVACARSLPLRTLVLMKQTLPWRIGTLKKMFPVS